MSLFSNLFKPNNSTSQATNQVDVSTTHSQHTTPTNPEPSKNSLMNVLMTPFRAVGTVVSKVLDVFPDPTKTGTLYDGVNQTYNGIAQTVIQLPQKILGNIPVVSVVGDVASSTLSAAFKAVGIVSDHFIMMGANAVEIVKAAVVGTVNGVDKVITGEAHVEFNGEAASNMDSIKEFVSHSASYTINNLEAHLVHDVDLIATIPDLLVDITRDIESNLDINLGSDYINKLVDSSVMGIRENVIDTLIDGAIKATEGLGLEFTDAGVMTHTTMDHVGEGNIREGYAAHGENHTDHEDGQNHDGTNAGQDNNNHDGANDHSGHTGGTGTNGGNTNVCTCSDHFMMMDSSQKIDLLTSSYIY